MILSRRLLHAEHQGVFVYGQLTRRMRLEFESKWLSRRRVIDDLTLEKPNFASTMNLYNVVANVFNTKPLLFDYENVIVIAVAALLPFAPIWLRVIPAPDHARPPGGHPLLGRTHFAYGVGESKPS